LFSIYINVDGIAFPCSFAEGKCDGVSIIDHEFMSGVWMSDPFRDFRKKVITNKDENGCRMCPLYNLQV
jgi:MoaA/NifB/PqqE/SkfB family radical SAM enzyme